MRAHCGSVSASERSPSPSSPGPAPRAATYGPRKSCHSSCRRHRSSPRRRLAVRVPASVTHTIGGLLVDEHARVLRADRTPVGGLYAAGATWAASSRAATGRAWRPRSCSAGSRPRLPWRTERAVSTQTGLGELRVGAKVVARERRGADLRHLQHALVGLDRRPDRGHVALTLLGASNRRSTRRTADGRRGCRFPRASAREV